MRVLIVRESALGDVILVEPVIRALKRRHPAARVELLTAAPYAELMRRRAGLDAVHPAPAGFSRLARWARDLEPFDLVVDLHGTLRARLVLALTRAQARRALPSDRGARRGHATARYLAALGPLGGPLGPRLARLGAERGRGVGLFPGASRATKRWPPERFAALAVRLKAAGIGPVRLVGAPQDPLDAVRMAAGPGVLEDGGAADTVEALADQIEPLDLLVSGDSGPAHLATALGVPTVVLFGPTDPRRWGPVEGPHQVVRRNLACMPCSRHGNARCPAPGRHHACLDGLSVERVLAAVKRCRDAAARAAGQGGLA